MDWFGGALRRARLDAKMSQESLAADLGVSGAAVSAWESGLAKPTFDNLVGIRQSLGVSVDELMQPGGRPVATLDPARIRAVDLVGRLPAETVAKLVALLEELVSVPRGR